MEILIPEVQGPSNPFLNRVKVVQGDIVTQAVDAIVTLIPKTLEYRGSLNQTILEAAGGGLDHFVLEHIVKPKVGDIYALPGFALPCQHIFFCVVPVWRAG